MKKIAILGASGHGKVVAEIAEFCGYEPLFFDDAFSEAMKSGHESEPSDTFQNFPWKVVGNTDSLITRQVFYDACFVAIGNNNIRAEKINILKEADLPLVSLIHPSAVVSKYAEIDKGSVVMANVVINPYVKVGEGCIINTGATIDHDCLLGNSVHISPGANLGGAVEVGDQSWIGIGSCVRQCISIGLNVTVGAGAAVVNDIPDSMTFVGVPAKSQYK